MISPPTRLGVYEFAELIGRGGIGEVYRARDTTLGRDVAIKVLPTEPAAQKERLERFSAVPADPFPGVFAFTPDGSFVVLEHDTSGERSRVGEARHPKLSAIFTLIRKSSCSTDIHERGGNDDINERKAANMTEMSRFSGDPGTSFFLSGPVAGQVHLNRHRLSKTSGSPCWSRKKESVSWRR